ncbi:phosphatase PAP2 family protein [Alicyclobacillus fastidiosus]|uniref:Phosphatase PAP2 family protein n=1 Tax=Alicyclobacillus fastidiosus TaxID=392011 RepID=A0ABV5ALB9_9BACL|nr:phosphatase PAP2 family protein [Alicyclobacillus fastidiosus]WEH11030.1 phosphatase PAP2 family protein [Alicyclobacillus fastidiosus]
MHSARKTRSLFSSVVFLLSFLATFAIFVEKLELHKLLGFDMKIIRLVQSRIDRPNTRLMKWFTFLGSPLPVSIFVAFATFVLLVKGRRREAASILVANAAGVGFNEVLKSIFRRRRPDIHRLVLERGYSFPSGHSMGSVIFYGTITYFICRGIRNALLKAVTCVVGMFMVFMTGISRIYLGVHYPSDVVSGYAAGGAWLSASIKGFNAILGKQKRS